MDQDNFNKIKQDFESADTDRKIQMYITARGLSGAQYKELLRMFPLDELHRLEEAMG